jgi:hypothetical protein
MITSINVVSNGQNKVGASSKRGTSPEPVNDPPPNDTPPKPYYRTIKQSLQNVLKHAEHQEVILRTVMSAHRIVIHTLQFLKLYLLDQYDTSSALPKVDTDLLGNIIR